MPSPRHVLKPQRKDKRSRPSRTPAAFGRRFRYSTISHAKLYWRVTQLIHIYCRRYMARPEISCPSSWTICSASRSWNRLGYFCGRDHPAAQRHAQGVLDGVFFQFIRHFHHHRETNSSVWAREPNRAFRLNSLYRPRLPLKNFASRSSMGTNRCPP